MFDQTETSSFVDATPATSSKDDVAFFVPDYTLNSKITPMGLATFKDAYLLSHENPQDLYLRVAKTYGSNTDHIKRLYHYMAHHWFSPATPVLSNGGTERGMPISCYLTNVDDSLKSIDNNWHESTWLSAKGGGLGINYSNVREMGAHIGQVGTTSGIIPFIKVQDAVTCAINQGCYDNKTEILTEDGWKKFSKLKDYKGRVAQVTQEGSTEFVYPDGYFEYANKKPLYHYTNKEGSINIKVTPNHRMGVQRQSKIDGVRYWKDGLAIVKAKNCTLHRDNRIWNTAPNKEGVKKHLTAKERLWIAYQADGSTNPTGTSNGAISGLVKYCFRFSKQRKIERLRSILAKVNYSYSENPQNDGTVNFLVDFPLDDLPSKSFKSWINLVDVAGSWCKEFVEEIMHWDGRDNSINNIIYFTTDKLNRDYVMSIACLAGYKVGKTRRDAEGNCKHLHRVHITTNTNTTVGEKTLRKLVKYIGNVFCVSVPSGLVLTRRGAYTAVCGNSLRRGTAAVYLDIHHPEIIEFMNIRKASGGDPRRKVFDLHNAVIISDAFMHAVEAGTNYDLISPSTHEVVKSISARDVWAQLIMLRMETGEPYMLFKDTVHRSTPDVHKALNMYPQSSNLCSEITLPTGKDYLGNERTAVCCLSSLNLEYYQEWKNNTQFIPDIMEMLDNILTGYITTAPEEFMKKAIYAAKMERSVGLGVMGFHSLLQSMNVPFESAVAKSLNMQIFKTIRKQTDQASIDLAEQRGPCPDAVAAGYKERFTYKMAVAPTATISILCGSTSPSIEPWMANTYTHKTQSGSFKIRNKYLTAVLENYGQNTDETWLSIIQNKSSVQHLDFLTEHEKLMFKTALELNQQWIIDLAADRAPYIDQAQSINLFFNPTEKTALVSKIHFSAWKKGVKSLYYCRSQSVQRAESSTYEFKKPEVAVVKDEFELPQDECLACT